MLGRRVHNVGPNRHRELMTECTAIDLLRLFEAGPNRAGKITVVSGEKRIGEIVGSAGLARHAGYFFQAVLRVRGLSRSGLKCIDQAGMDFISCLRFDDVLPAAGLPLCVPDRAVLFFDALQNVGRVWSPAPVWKYRVSKRELGERDLAAAEKRRRIRTQWGTNARRATKLQDLIDAGVHSDANGCAAFRFGEGLPRR